MKKLLLFLLLFTNICIGQTTIFSENMGTPSGTTTIAANNFQNITPITFSGTADVRMTTPSTYTGASGNGNIFITNTIGRYFEISGINTTNYNNISMSFGHFKSINASDGTELKIEVSTDGINYNTLTFTPRATGSGTSNWLILNAIGQIPSCNNLRIKFTQTSSTSSLNFRIDDVLLTGYSCSGTSTWTGSWSSTPNGKSVVIASNYNTSTNGSFEACSLTVNSGYTLNINSGFVKVQNDITNNGTINITNSGSLVQVNDSGTNTGNITYNRDVSSLHGYDYIYWSSPVNSQTLSLYSSPTPGTSYLWNPTVTSPNGITNGSWQYISPSSSMTRGRGYIMRASSSYGWTGNLTSVFYGIPNNGIITQYTTAMGTSNINDGWNLLGNPYPSALNAIEFLKTNTDLSGYVALWKHANAPSSSATQPYYQSFQYNYSNDYVVYNSSGASSGLGTFNGYIATGQGFFVNLPNITSSTVIFNNSMRSETYSNSQFFKTYSDVENGRIWLDLLDVNNTANRILVGYVDGATNDNDRMYDAETALSTSNNTMYSVIENKPYIIQGKGEFQDTDQVQLGINVNTPGEYKIAIGEVDGIFTSQDIFLEDLYTNTIFDIRQSPYIFTTNSGSFNDRFVLRYTDGTLGTNNPVKNNTIVYSNNNNLYITSNEVINNVDVYDVTGRLLSTNKFNNTNVQIDKLNCKVVIIKIKLDNGLIVSKKVISL